MADRLVQRGVPLRAPDPALLRERAHAVTVMSPSVADTLESWLDAGGCLAIVGPSGSGRSHILDWVATELQARGRPWVRMVCNGRPWNAVEQALASPTLPSSPAALPDMEGAVSLRAEAAATALSSRSPSSLTVLVDDLQSSHETVRLTLEALSRLDAVQICVTCPHPPHWAQHRCVLGPLNRQGTAQLAAGILGSVNDSDRLVDLLLDIADGLPSPTTSFLLHAAQSGALLYRARHWLLDEQRWGALLAEGVPELDLQSELSHDALTVGAILAIHELPTTPVFLAQLADMSLDVTVRALDELQNNGLVRFDQRLVSFRGRSAATTLRSRHPRPKDIHRRLVSHLLEQRDVRWERLGWHLVGTRDATLAREHGPRAIGALCRQAPEESARLADSLWALAPVPEMVSPRMRALVAAGRVEQAQSFGEGFLTDREAGPLDIPVMGMLAAIHANFTGHDEAALSWVQRAQTTLGDDPLPEELVEVEAKVHFRAGRFAEAMERARQIADCPPPERPDRLDRWLAMRVVWAQALQRQSRLTPAIALLEQVSPEVGEGRPSRALLEAALGRLLWHGNRLREAADVMAHAARHDSGLPVLDRARLLNNSGTGRYMVGDRSGALQMWEQALLLFQRLEVPLEQVRVQTNLCVGYRESGQWERAQAAGTWALQRAEELDAWEYMAMAAGNLGDLHLARGDWQQADTWFQRAWKVATDHKLKGEQVELARRNAELAVLRRDPQATELCHTARAAARSADATIERCKATVLLAVCLARQGRLRQMEALLDEAIEPLKQAGASGELAEIRLWTAEAYLAAGRTVEALQQATRALVYADEVEHIQIKRRADTLVDRLRSVQGVDTRSQQMNRLLELAVAVARERDLKRLLDAIAGAALDLLDGERSFVLLDKGSDLEVAAAKLREGVEPGQPSITIARRALRDGREIIAADLGERADLRVAQSVMAMELRSAMCVPMMNGEQKIGAIYVDSRAANHQELSQAARLLRALASHAAVAVANARYLEDVAQRAAQAAEIAHDLRSPAAAVHSVVTQLLTEHAIDDTGRELLQQALEATGRIQAMAGEFLEEHRSHRRRTDLSQLVLRLGRLLAHDAQRQGVGIELLIAPGVHVIGNADRLSRAITNLITNAVKYSPTGETVTVELGALAGMATATVRDRGPGIPADALQSIFARGVQAQGARHGHGLGLAIARKVLEEHGGTVSATNHPEGGAVFTLQIPLASPE